MIRAGILVVAVALIAGCGGGGGGGRLSKEELDSKANAICAKYSQKIDAVGQPNNIEDLPPYVDKVIPLIKDGTDELDALNPPKDLEPKFDEMIAEQRRSLELAKNLKKAAEDKNEDEVNRLVAEGGKQNDRFDQLATEIGAETCAED